MGYYIEVPNHRGKAKQLVELHGGEIVPPIKAVKDIPKGKILVVVMDNGGFEAAGVAFDQQELQAFTHPLDKRPKTFILMDEEVVYSLQPYVRGCIDYHARNLGKCELCGITVTGFRDTISLEEWKISGMCQLCQDLTFQGSTIE